jgi:hypothetical protein
MKELEKRELFAIDGGYTKMPPWVKGGLWFGIACTIVEHWTDIKSGIADGWNDAMKE